MEISEKVAYLKGLAEGLNLDTDSKEGKLIAAIIDVLDDMAEKFAEIDDELCDMEDGLTPSATISATWRKPCTSRWTTMRTRTKTTRKRSAS